MRVWIGWLQLTMLVVSITLGLSINWTVVIVRVKQLDFVLFVLVIVHLVSVDGVNGLTSFHGIFG